jgi:hypothetical protein
MPLARTATAERIEIRVPIVSPFRAESAVVTPQETVGAG